MALKSEVFLGRHDRIGQRVRTLCLADLFSRLDLQKVMEGCDVEFSIRKARITENTGEMILDLQGSRANLAGLRQSLAELGMEVELIEEKQII